MTEVIYTVRINRAEFPADSRRRAGIVIPSEGGYVGPLTSEQVKAIKADKVLSISKGDNAGDQGNNDEAAIKAAEQVLEAAKAEAEKIVAAAKKEAEEVRAAATAEATKTTEAAKAEAEKIVAAAKKPDDKK